MSIICGLDLHRQQITFDALETETGMWRGWVWRPDRERLRRWLTGDVARRADGEPVVMAWRAAPAGATWSRRMTEASLGKMPTTAWVWICVSSARDVVWRNVAIVPSTTNRQAMFVRNTQHLRNEATGDI
jgi:hypothetical protein